MSWDGYVQSVIDNCPQDCDAVTIIGKDGSQWTTDGAPNHLKLNPGEAQTISKCFNTKDFTAMESGGVRVGGVKYQFLRNVEGKTVLAKKKDQGAITISSTKQAVIVAHTAEGKQHGNTNTGVEKVVEYLENTGY